MIGKLKDFFYKRKNLKSCQTCIFNNKQRDLCIVGNHYKTNIICFSGELWKGA